MDSYRKPGDYRLRKLEMTTRSGNKIDLIRLSHGWNIYMSIYDMNISADIIMVDGISAVESFPILGQEEVYIELSTPGDEKIIRLNMQTYKISNRTYDNNNKVNTYVLHLTTRDNMTGIQSKISHVEIGRTDEIVKNVFNEMFEAIPDGTKKLEAEECKYTHKIVFPSTNIWESLSLLSGMAISKSCHVSTFFFYEDLEKYNFRSIEDMVEAEVPKNFRYFLENSAAVGATRDSEKANMLIQKMVVTKDFDTLMSTNYGMFGSRTVGHDMVTKKIHIHEYDYFSHVGPTLYSEGVIDNISKNKLNSYDSFTRIVRTDSERKSSPWIKSHGGDDLEFFNANCRNNGPRNARLLLLDYFKVHVELPGDLRLNPGMVIEIIVPSTIEGGDNNPGNDRRMSGKYLITTVKHMFMNDTFTTVLEVIKDSFEKKLNHKSGFTDVETGPNSGEGGHDIIC